VRVGECYKPQSIADRPYFIVASLKAGVSSRVGLCRRVLQGQVSGDGNTQALVLVQPLASLPTLAIYMSPAESTHTIWRSVLDGLSQPQSFAEQHLEGWVKGSELRETWGTQD